MSAAPPTGGSRRGPRPSLASGSGEVAAAAPSPAAPERRGRASSPSIAPTTSVRKDVSRQLMRRQLAKEDIFFFARWYFPAYFPDPPAAFHRELIELALAAGRPREERTTPGDLVIAAPRGHAKSTLLTFLLPLYWIVFGTKHFILIVSDTKTAATSFLQAIKKELEDNERLRADFGLVCGHERGNGPRQKWTSSELAVNILDKNGMIISTTHVVSCSTRSQLRGIRRGPHRPDAVLCDDLENDEAVQTPEMRTKTFDWFTKALVPVLHPKQGSLIVIGTILHFDSLLQKLLTQGNGTGTYTTRVYRAIDEHGRVLWPERFSPAKLANLKSQLGTLAFNSEYLNRPIDDATRIFQPKWLQWYSAHEVVYDERTRRWYFRGELLEIFVGVDPAISERETADNFALVVVGRARKQKAFIILYTFADRIDFPSQVQEIIRLEAAWQPQLIGIEDVAYQKALPQQLIRESLVLGTKLKPLRNTVSKKYTRIAATSVRFENGRVFLRQALDHEGGDFDELGQRRVHPHMLPLYTELMQYPRSAHDDVLDAMENAFQLADYKGRIFEDELDD